VELKVLDVNFKLSKSFLDGMEGNAAKEYDTGAVSSLLKHY
jgi:hypothetical protein